MEGHGRASIFPGDARTKKNMAAARKSIRPTGTTAMESDEEEDEVGELTELLTPEEVLKGSSKRRLTSLYSEQQYSSRRGSVGGMSTLAIETELGKLQMFSGCSQELLADLSHAAQSQMAADGLVIHGKGDHSDAMMIVLRGCVGVCVGDECIMQLRKGDHLGETLFLAVEDYWSVQLVAQDLCDSALAARDPTIQWQSQVLQLEQLLAQQRENLKGLLEAQQLAQHLELQPPALLAALRASPRHWGRT